jgi:hypothetical protein
VTEINGAQHAPCPTRGEGNKLTKCLSPVSLRARNVICLDFLVREAPASFYGYATCPACESRGTAARLSRLELLISRFYKLERLQNFNIFSSLYFLLNCSLIKYAS